jgi:hypothetical protein
MRLRILTLALLAGCYPSHTHAAETNLIVETTSRGPAPLVVPCGDGANLILTEFS